MGLKYFIRTKLINVIKDAMREESERKIQMDGPQFDNLLINSQEEQIIKILDKQIERWTWERFLRTERTVESWTWERYERLRTQIDSMQVNIGMEVDRSINHGANNLAKKTNLYDETKKIDKLIERWTWERYKRSEDKLLHVYKLQNQISELLFAQNKTPYKPAEKIRVVFLFQVASFWPSWETLYETCLEDGRFDVKMLFLDETVREAAQMKTAKKFLDTKGIEYIEFSEFDMDDYQPHALFIQTPYDAGHRIKAHWSSAWKAKGYRVIYVPYGIEISDTETSRGMHFEQHVIENSWRIYTFSETMLKDYRKYCSNAKAVRALGLPKFDSLYNKEKFKLSEDLISRIDGRKICLWKVHFPKIFEENGKDIFVTPDMNEYIKFAEYAIQHKEMFFIFMPHPRFKEPVKNKMLQELAIQLMSMLEGVDNVFVDLADDYRPSLVNADSIIIDRSAIMVEAAAIDVPVLYMVNEEFYEPVTKAIEPLMNSYKQGTTCNDMITFITDCSKNVDTNKQERQKAFKQCIPYFDGKCAERIKDDIANDVSANI